MKNLVKNNIFSKYRLLQKNFKIAMDGIIRPSSGDLYFRQAIHVYPKFPFHHFILYDLAYNSDTLTSIHNSLRRELFRNGYDLVEAEKTDEEITTSEQETMPKGKNREEILNFLEHINENRQGLIDVCMELEDDLSIMDDAFMVFLFTYEFNDNGKILNRELSQVLRGDPRFMGLIMNKYDRPGYDDDDKKLTFCPQHRENLLTEEKTCPNCSIQTFQAFYFKDYEGQKMYYARWEAVFRSKYRPSTRRGYSPVLTTWQKVRTLLFMDKYIMQLYDGQRPPKHLLAFKTSNQKALEKAIDEARQKIRDNPHWPMEI